jgi:hypothetical protein
MSKKITIYKWKTNTQWCVDVEDGYGSEHFLGYYDELDSKDIEAKAEEIWANEVKPKEDLMGKAIAECIQSDIDRGVEPSLD